jgi:hypothetical protein
VNTCARVAACDPFIWQKREKEAQNPQTLAFWPLPQNQAITPPQSLTQSNNQNNKHKK